MTCIVVPVYNAPRELERCLEALSRTISGRARVVVLDDASDEPDVPGIIERLAENDWTCRRWHENVGFVVTANRGIELADGDDVILLNADTVPAGEWLMRIERCARSAADIASVTPWSNNAEIASLPGFCRAGPMPESPEAWARACAGAGEPEYPAIPTAVGFCMWMSRRAIDEIGVFDAAAFGRGYGEENDWCMRAADAGWRHVLCDDAFVAHQGGASFGPLGLLPGEETLSRVLERHPDYLARVTDFIDRDPLADRRRAVVGTYNAGMRQGAAT